MLKERIAESLENILLAISVSWVIEVAVFILFLVLAVGLIPFDVQTQQQRPARVKLKCGFCSVAFLSHDGCAT